jgi:hypothetical protein
MWRSPRGGYPHPRKAARPAATCAQPDGRAAPRGIHWKHAARPNGTGHQPTVTHPGVVVFVISERSSGQVLRTTRNVATMLRYKANPRFLVRTR